MTRRELINAVTNIEANSMYMDMGSELLKIGDDSSWSTIKGFIADYIHLLPANNYDVDPRQCVVGTDGTPFKGFTTDEELAS